MIDPAYPCWNEKQYFTIRDSQLELLNYACNHNTILAMSDGNAKKFIAILLLKEYAYRMAEKNEKALILTRSSISAEQFQLDIEYHTNLRIFSTFKISKRPWDTKKEFDNYMDSFDVMIASGEYLSKNVLDPNYFDFSRLALLIVDECHYCLRPSDFYFEIMGKYRQKTAEKESGCLPRVLGLTSSIVDESIASKMSDLAPLEMLLNRLQKIMCCRLETVNDLISNIKYGTPLQAVLKCRNPIRSGMSAKAALEDCISFLTTYHEMKGAFVACNRAEKYSVIQDAIFRTISVLEQLGPWCAWKCCNLYYKRISAIDMTGLPAAEKSAIRVATTALYVAMERFASEIGNAKTLRKLEPFLDGRLLKLLQLISPFHPKEKRDALCALVFVRDRMVAYCIHVLLKHLAEIEKDDFGFVMSNFIVGNKGTKVYSKEDSKTSPQQNVVLQKFRSGGLNLLVTTSIMEEGIDVRDCNLVVRFDPPTNLRSFLQV